MNARSISFATITLFATAAIAYEAVIIDWKPKVGSTLKYESVTTFPGHAGGEMEVIENVKHKITSVGKDKVTVEELIELDRVVSDGADVTSAMGRQEPEPRTLTLNPFGTVVSREGSVQRALSNPRIDRIMSFVFSKNPVSPGDKWTLKLTKTNGLAAVEGTLTYVGAEESLGRKTHKIKVEVAEVGVSEPISAIRTVWVSTADGSLVRSEAKLKNMPMPHDMAPVTATVVWQLAK